MFTLLRKIRKALIESGSTRKYLVYAIGEILLVVIGILIALQINNWNQDRLDKAYEMQMLSEIYHGLKADSTRMTDWVLPRIERKVRGVDNMARHVYAGEPISLDTLRRDYAWMWQGMSPTINFGPYEALKSNGLEKIKDNTIRFWLVDVFESVFPKQLNTIDKVHDLYDLQNSQMDQQLWRWSIIMGADGELEERAFPRSTDILNDESLAAVISNMRHLSNVQSHRVGTLIEGATLTLQRLREYLAMHNFDPGQNLTGSAQGVRGLLRE